MANTAPKIISPEITAKTKLILFVHWGGYPVDLDRVKAIVDRAEERLGFRPMVIEDCAHAYGTRYKNELLGNHGNMACFSLQAIKHFTTVDGGFLTLPNQELYRRSKLLRWYGIDRDAPKERNMPISARLSRTTITRVETILKAATATTSNKIIKTIDLVSSIERKKFAC